MFVTDNNQFDKTCIDCLEWYFIDLFKSSIYTLDNSQLRNKEPNVDKSFTKPTILNFAEQIKFLLEANGIALNISVSSAKSRDRKIYPAINTINAKMFIHDGRYILQKGSVITLPKNSTQNYNDNGKFHNRYKNRFNELLTNGKSQLKPDNNTAILLEDLICSSPSFAGSLCNRLPINGYYFWIGLEDDRRKDLENNN